MFGRTNAVTMAPILEVVLGMPESFKPKTELSAAGNAFRHVVEWVRLALLTEYDNVMDICRIVKPLTPLEHCIRMFHYHHRTLKFEVYHLYRLKNKCSVSLRYDIVSFGIWGYIKHMRTELQAHVQSLTRMAETQNTDGLATFIRNKV